MWLQAWTYLNNKSDGNYTKPCPYIFTPSGKDVGTDDALYIYNHLYPSLFAHILASHSYISFLIFLSCFCTFLGNVFKLCCEVNNTLIKCNYNLETVLIVE